MIISFYSYKGGVGRSQLCANIAAYLCFKKGKKVLLWDWDFEAPGLHYFFEKENSDFDKSGTIEMFEKYVTLMRSNPRVEEKDIQFLSSESIIHLKEGEVVKGSKGKIDLIPAGTYDEHFVYKVNSFNWFEFYELLDGITYIEKVKEWVKSLGYDYILVDSRTGINDYSGICNIQLPDTNVIVMAANEQNIAGSRRIIDQILDSEYVKATFRRSYVLPILSKIDTGHPQFEYWITRFVDEFSFLLSYFDSNIDTAFTEEVFRDFYLTRTCLEYVPTYSAGENLLINSLKQNISNASFTSKYVNIGEYLDNLNTNENIGMFNQISKDSWLAFAEEADTNSDREKKAMAYSNANEYDKSIEFGGTFEAFLQKGNDYNLKGSFEKAISSFQKAIEINPKSYQAFFNLGFAYTNKKEFDKAIDCFQTALEIKPNDYQAIFNLGLAYIENEGLDSAIESLQRAIEIAPNNNDPFFHLGIAYYCKKEFDRAIEYYQKGVAIKPDDYRALLNIGTAYSNKKEFDKSIEYYQRAIEIKPDYYHAFFNMGLAYREKKELVRAIECFQRAATFKSDEGRAFVNMGIAYSDNKEFDGAIESFQKAIDINSDNARAWNGLGFAFIVLGDLQSAHKTLIKAIELGSTDFGNMNLGHVYLAQGKEEDALTCYKKGIAAWIHTTPLLSEMTDDFQYLRQYGITEEYYQNILKQLNLVG